MKDMEEMNLSVPVSIVALVDSLIESAYNLGASDMHVDPQANAVRVRFRIDGRLCDQPSLSKLQHSEIIARIKILANLKTDQHYIAQDGRFCAHLPTGPLDIRVSMVPTYYGENAVLRLLKNQYESLSLDKLGFCADHQQKILRTLRQSYGMVLVTGPTGSGKTTTLYALMKLLNTVQTSVISIEDPIEYSLEGVRQIGVNAKTGLTFANGLRSLLRQDPDVIMVGEIRDQETAGLAINTALTGHLILSTIHTNNAIATLPRFIDLGIEPYLIASTVNLVISQRLVRTICQNCKQVITITDAQISSLSEVVDLDSLFETAVFYQGMGCDVCNHTGYRGRICVNEVLVVDNLIKNAIYNRATALELNHLARQQGMKQMIEDGFLKAKAGITSIEEIVTILHE